MKQLFLAVAVFFMAATASKAQGTLININNSTTYTLYMVLSADATCSTPNRASVVIPPGPGTITYMDPTFAGIPGTVSTDRFYEVRFYNYDPATSCYPQQSVNVSPCTPGLPLMDFITIYDMCLGGTPLPVTIQWDNSLSPTSVDLNIF